MYPSLDGSKAAAAESTPSIRRPPSPTNHSQENYGLPMPPQLHNLV